MKYCAVADIDHGVWVEVRKTPEEVLSCVIEGSHLHIVPIPSNTPNDAADILRAVHRAEQAGRAVYIK
jgi:hypothetical protein